MAKRVKGVNNYSREVSVFPHLLTKRHQDAIDISPIHR